MAEYGDWIEQEELDYEETPQVRAPRGGAPSDPSYRKSVVLHDLASPSSVGKPKPKPPVPASKAPGGRAPPPIPAPKGSPAAAAAAAGETSERGSQESRERSHTTGESRLFPGLKIHSRTEKIKSGKKEEDYAMEWKWPWALLGIFFLLGGVALAIFGGWCIRQNPTGDLPPPTTELDACGPGKGLI